MSIKLANFLNNNNYNVLLYDIRSHGQSKNNSNYVIDINNFHIFIDDLNLIINSLKQKNNLQNILLGHSLGRMINNCYVYKYNNVEGVIIPVGLNYERLSRLPLTQEMKNLRSIKFLTANFINNNMVLSIQYFQENLINHSFIHPQSLFIVS
ncbi:alpha/beta fold hydrolase [Candidatus Phytoplasma fraxini]|uniref:Hydrolase, alpha/beta fold family n=1 Tax=Ash yellows phytoplasma TaxID=35780 RepID=A0ABZ2U8A6_ASHYP